MRAISWSAWRQWGPSTSGWHKVVNITIIKGACSDTVMAVRRDGTGTSFEVPHKGPIPHDAVHFFVERQLGLGNAFWGAIARGDSACDIGARAIASGHASAKRASVPDREIVELLQAERLVECFEADLWSGTGDAAGIPAMARSGWDHSLVGPLDLSSDDIGTICTEIAHFADEWANVQTGSQIQLIWV